MALEILREVDRFEERLSANPLNGRHQACQPVGASNGVQESSVKDESQMDTCGQSKAAEEEENSQEDAKSSGYSSENRSFLTEGASSAGSHLASPVEYKPPTQNQEQTCKSQKHAVEAGWVRTWTPRNLEDAAEELFEDPGVRELSRWWENIVPEFEEKLSVDEVINMVQHVTGGSRASCEWVVGSLDALGRAAVGMAPVGMRTTRRMTSVLTGGINFASSQRSNLKSEMLAVSFDAFVKLILWRDIADLLAAESKPRLLQLREILIQTIVDKLIETYSHWPMPNFHQLERPWWEYVVETAVGCMVLLNAALIGIACDLEWPGFDFIEIGFALFFLCELCFKIYMLGFVAHFETGSRSFNIFEAMIVFVALVDVGVTLNFGSNDTANLGIMRLARLLRMARMMRLLRLMRLDICKPLMMMLKGVVAGLRTLLWAIVLLVIMVFSTAVLLRQTVGEGQFYIDGDSYRTPLFSSMAWSMFNVFRCFIGQCTLSDGTPIEVHLYQRYGASFVLPYSGCMIFTTFGIFNLIMAIFVENVQEAAKQKQMLFEESERARVWVKLRQLVLRFGGAGTPSRDRATAPRLHRVSQLLPMMHKMYDGGAVQKGKDDEPAHFVLGGRISRHMFDVVTQMKDTKWLLDDLEIYVADPVELFDVLDADGSAYIDMTELIDGLLKLRSGGADKSDIVSVILGVRTIQKNLVNAAEAQQELAIMLQDCERIGQRQEGLLRQLVDGQAEALGRRVEPPVEPTVPPPPNDDPPAAATESGAVGDADAPVVVRRTPKATQEEPSIAEDTSVTVQNHALLKSSLPSTPPLIERPMGRSACTPARKFNFEALVDDVVL